MQQQLKRGIFWLVVGMLIILLGFLVWRIYPERAQEKASFSNEFKEETEKGLEESTKSTDLLTEDIGLDNDSSVVPSTPETKKEKSETENVEELSENLLPKETASPESSSHQRMPLSFFKGIWAQPGGEEKALSNDSQKMLEDGVNIFAIAVSYEINPDGSLTMVPLNYKWDFNPEAGYLNLIKTAHNAGLGVFLEVEFNPFWEEGEFSSLSLSLQKKILQRTKEATLHWAEIGEKEQVELFSPINEPANVFGKEAGFKWIEDILPEIKKKYTGSTNVKLYGIEVGDFSSYGSIKGYDYVSVNVYAIDVSDEEFMQYIKEEVMPYMENCVQKYQLKGFLFGEMGIPASNPHQSQLFNQFFENTWQEAKGYLLSGWGPKVMMDDSFPDMQYTDRPAEEVIKYWYHKIK